MVTVCSAAQVLFLFPFLSPTETIAASSGNAEVLKRVNVDFGAFAQISRRVPRREEIKGILDADADAITNTFGVEGLDCYAIMRRIGARFHADGVVQLLSRARKITASGKVIKLHDIYDALELMPAMKAALDGKNRHVRR